MSDPKANIPFRTLSILFTIFICGSTFSIALAQIALGLSLAMFCWIIFSTKYNPVAVSLKSFYILIVVNVGWMIICAMAGHTPSASLFVLKEEWLFLIVPIGILVLANEKTRHRVLIALATLVGIISLYGILQHFTGIDFYRAEPLHAAEDFGFKVRGNFSHRLTFGNYYGMAALFFFGIGIIKGKDISDQTRKLLLFVSFLAMVATVLSYCRSVVAALVIVLLIAGLLLGKRIGIAVITSTVIIVITIWFAVPGLAGRFTEGSAKDLNTSYEGGRLFIWANSWDIAVKNPIFGVGAGNFGPEYESRLRADIEQNRKHIHAHNDLLNIAVINGFPGAILFAALWLLVLFKMFRLYRLSENSVTKRWALAGLLGSLMFLLGSATEATFADEEVRQALMFVWAAGLWPLYNMKSAT